MVGDRGDRHSEAQGQSSEEDGRARARSAREQGGGEGDLGTGRARSSAAAKGRRAPAGASWRSRRRSGAPRKGRSTPPRRGRPHARAPTSCGGAWTCEASRVREGARGRRLASSSHHRFTSGTLRKQPSEPTPPPRMPARSQLHTGVVDHARSTPGASVAGERSTPGEGARALRGMHAAAMPIQWYPGHMRKARQAMAESMPSQDVVIEVLDARMPRASENPMVTELRGRKPCIKVLGKSDLADPGSDQGMSSDTSKAIGPGTSRRSPFGSTERRRFGRASPSCRRALVLLHPSGLGKVRPRDGRRDPERREIDPHQHAHGGGRSRRSETRPAVTKAEQKVTLKNGMTLSKSNPGITLAQDRGRGGLLPPRARRQRSPTRRSTTRAWRCLGPASSSSGTPSSLRARYKLVLLPEKAEDLLREIGRRRGGVRAGGVVDLHKAADILVHDFRAGSLGRISLESPR